MTGARQAAAGYLTLQAVAGLAWWLLLFVRPATRWWFFPEELGNSTWAFAPPDLALFVLGSAVAGWAIGRGRRWATGLAWAVCGGTWYACLYCWGGGLLYGSGWLGVLLMTAAAAMTTVAAALASDGGWALRLFRPAPERSTAGSLWLMLGQTLAFWGLLLFVIPFVLEELASRAGVPGWSPGIGQRIAAVVVFLLAGALGIWSGVTMACAGAGTPLPMDEPSRLVVTGPYRRLRNPMAVAGLIQGLAVGLWLGSLLVLAYVVIGALVWHLVVRPLEEEDLARRFGREYDEYRRQVPCWRPRWRGHEPAKRPMPRGSDGP